jgi:hypothetical protein
MKVSVFRSHKELFSFLIGTLLIFTVFISIPVLFIPGNSISYYFSIEPWWGFALLGILSAEISFILTKRIFVALEKRKLEKGFVKDSIAIIGSILPSVLACPILAVTVLSFIFPITTVWTLVGLQWYIIGATTFLMSFVVAYRIKKIHNIC